MHTAVRPIHIQLFTRVPNTRQHFRFALYAIETDRFHVTRENIVGEVGRSWSDARTHSARQRAAVVVAMYRSCVPHTVHGLKERHGWTWNPCCMRHAAHTIPC